MKIIKGLAMMIFMGYLVLWIVTPTSVFYNKWLVRETAHTTSTYFEAQGNLVPLHIS
ncbi:hypothetical protein Hanom_Chr06g00511331 [Helianthus anomalus]